MLDLAMESVERWRATESAARIDERRILRWNVANGLIDGTCFLFFDEAGAPLVVAKTARTKLGKETFDQEYENLRFDGGEGIWHDR